MQKILIPLFIIHQHDTNYATLNSNTVSFHLDRRLIDEIISRIVFDTLTFITCYTRGGGEKNVWDWRRDESGRKSRNLPGPGNKTGKRSRSHVRPRKRGHFARKTKPPGKASWSTQLCVTQGPINRTCIARNGPLAFFFFSFFFFFQQS